MECEFVWKNAFRGCCIKRSEVTSTPPVKCPGSLTRGAATLASLKLYKLSTPDLNNQLIYGQSGMTGNRNGLSASFRFEGANGEMS